MYIGTLVALVTGGLGLISLLWGPAILARREGVKCHDIRVIAAIGKGKEVRGVDGGEVLTAVWLLIRCSFRLYKVRGESETSVRSKQLRLGRRSYRCLAACFELPADGKMEQNEKPWKRLPPGGGHAAEIEFSETYIISPSHELAQLLAKEKVLADHSEFLKEVSSAEASERIHFPERVIKTSEEWQQEQPAETNGGGKRKSIETRITQAITGLEVLAAQVESDPDHVAAWQRGDGRWFYSRHALQRLLAATWSHFHA